MQYYDEEAHQFLADRYITGTCPHCNNERAYGDQCEACGTSLSATDLINPKSVLSGNAPVMKETKHWYLPLNEYEPWLKEWILKGHKEDWKSNVYGQCKSWIEAGLQPRAVTRDLDWGVKVPLEEAAGKVLYVWFDAPIGYISFTKEWAAAHNQDWEKWWKDKDTQLVHFIGKDNIVFHCIIFPCMLKAEGSYILPVNVPANEFLNLEGDKISTSRNWAVWLHEYLEDFPGKQDVLRYTLTSIAPETKDADFTWADFQAKNNNELLAIFGNLVNRTIVLTHKYYGGVIPEMGELTDYEKEVIEKMKEFPTLIGNSIEKYRFREAQAELMNLARLGNKYLTDMEPWKKQKEDPERVKTVMHLSLQLCADLAVLCEPFLPFTSQKLQKMLNMDVHEWNEGGRCDLLKAGDSINPAEYGNGVEIKMELLGIQFSESHLPVFLLDAGFQFIADGEQGPLTEALHVSNLGNPFGVGYTLHLDTGTTLAAHVHILAACTDAGTHAAGAAVQEADIVAGFFYLVRVDHFRISYRFNQRHTQTVGAIDTGVTNIGDLAACVFLHAELDEAHFLVFQLNLAVDTQNSGTLETGRDGAVEVLLTGDMHFAHNFQFGGQSDFQSVLQCLGVDGEWGSVVHLIGAGGFVSDAVDDVLAGLELHQRGAVILAHFGKGGAHVT